MCCSTLCVSSFICTSGAFKVPQLWDEMKSTYCEHNLGEKIQYVNKILKSKCSRYF